MTIKLESTIVNVIHSGSGSATEHTLRFWVEPLKLTQVIVSGKPADALKPQNAV